MVLGALRRTLRQPPFHPKDCPSGPTVEMRYRGLRKTGKKNAPGEVGELLSTQVQHLHISGTIDFFSHFLPKTYISPDFLTG